MDEVISERGGIRYFVVKAHTFQELNDSFENGWWDAKLPIKKKIWEACKDSGVVLIVALNGSRHFCGYAAVDADEDGTIVDQVDAEEMQHKKINIAWKKLCHLPFRSVKALQNTVHNNKPLIEARSGQELDSSCAKELLSLLDDDAVPQDTPASLHDHITQSDHMLGVIASADFHFPPDFVSEELKLQAGSPPASTRKQRDGDTERRQKRGTFLQDTIYV
ncbi:CPSF30 [Symbiodinium microadriaticum]|nr:CPSF30 [Symbiodinium microadriaticum]